MSACWYPGSYAQTYHGCKVTDIGSLLVPGASVLQRRAGWIEVVLRGRGFPIPMEVIISIRAGEIVFFGGSIEDCRNRHALGA